MLEIQNIVKQYANHLALDNVSLSIPKGGIFGLLGPNGAGKTSLIRIINQITAPDAGQIFFDGSPLASSHVQRIGYLPEERGLYKKMKVGDQLIYLAQLKGLSKFEAKQRIDYWFERFNIGGWWNKQVEDLSKGMQQKVQFIATVIHEPELLILDEPFSGFDPVNAQSIQDVILELNKKGVTIIYSTHRMETVEELCDNIALINKSKKILDGSITSIKEKYKTSTFKIFYQNGSDTHSLDSVVGLYDVIERHESNGTTYILIKLNPDTRLNDVIAYLLDKIEIMQITEIIPSIHDIFIEQVTKIDNSHA